jgi:Methylpurine-DNA glycosylase (MPG)
MSRPSGGAFEPLEGLSVMQCRRGTTRADRVAKGPGRLATAMAIDQGRDGIDLCAGCVMLRTAALDGYDPAAPLVLVYLAGARLPTTSRYFHPSAPRS